MMGPFLTHALMSGRLLCPRCQTCLMAMGLRFASQTHYKTLGIEKCASQEEIRSAFLSLSKRLHPDVNRQDPQNHEKFVKVNEAYTILSKPFTRREYDLTIAAQIRTEQQARNASTSHVHGSSAWPGSGSNPQHEGEQQQQFWDETIWHMRDKSKDKEFEGKPYYGFTNMRRLSNFDILLGCFALMVVGVLMHYVVISKARKLHKAILDENDRVHYSNLAKARSYARSHGNTLQLQILKSKLNNTPVEGVSEETMSEVFRSVKK